MSGASKNPDSLPGQQSNAKHPPPERGRWHRLLHTSADAIFVLNHKRQLLFANAAWERLTGLSFSQARGRTCKPSAKSDLDRVRAILQVMAPPTEVHFGEPITTRRVSPTADPSYWEISYFSVQREKGRAAFVCKIVPLARAKSSDRAPLPNKLHSLRDRRAQWHRLEQIGDATPAGQRVRQQAQLAGRTLNPVYIAGEPGTGKQWLARTIHLHGPTRDRCFVVLDCRRLNAAILNNTLFGVRGVLASRTVGSIYFKDPQFLSKELQAQFVEWWSLSQASESDTESANADKPVLRLLAGGSVELDSRQEAKDLLEEFRCLFSVLTIRLLPLRERKANFTELTQRLLKRAVITAGQEITDLSPEAWDCLRAFPWPENLDELYRVLRQACQRSKQSVIHLQDLPLYLREPAEKRQQSLPLDEILENVERRLVQLAMQRANQNKSKAAEHLSIWRGRLIRRLKELGL